VVTVEVSMELLMPSMCMVAPLTCRPGAAGALRSFTVRIGLSEIRAGSLDVNSIRGRRTSHGRYDPTEHSLRSRGKYRKGSGEAAIYWPAARKPGAHRRGHESYAGGLNVEKAASHPRVMS